MTAVNIKNIKVGDVIIAKWGEDCCYVFVTAYVAATGLHAVNGGLFPADVCTYYKLESDYITIQSESSIDIE